MPPPQSPLAGRTAVLSSLLWTACACSSVPTVEGMTVRDFEGGKQPCTIAVVVVVSESEADAWMPDRAVINARLGEALEASVRATGAFREVVPKETADRVLEVVFHRFTQEGGFSMSVDIVAMWTLRDREAKAISQSAVSGHGEAGFFEAIWGATRVRLCLERAAHALILRGLEATAPAATSQRQPGGGPLPGG